MPELSVVVPSHSRPLRLRWLLNALADQTLDRSRWEVLVGHDGGQETERVLREHPLAQAGLVRAARHHGATGSRAANRNAALALASSPTVVFTHDDCRPPPDWLERVLDAVSRHPDAVIQGSVVADPDEGVMHRSPYPRTLEYLDVPRVWGECANTVYPRELLDRLGGFLEAGWASGEDTDLLLRARAAGAPYVGDSGMQTRHAVDEGWLPGRLLRASRRRDLPALVARHPELREHLTARVFCEASHAWLVLAACGAAISWSRACRGRTRPRAAAVALAGSLAGCVPYARERSWRGGDVRAWLRHLSELPGWVVIDLAEIAVLARASLRSGTLVL